MSARMSYRLVLGWCHCHTTGSTIGITPGIYAGEPTNDITSPHAASHLAQMLQHALRVAFGLDPLPDVADDPIRTDVEGRARHTHIFPAVHALLNPDAVTLRHVAAFVAEQREG